MRRRGLGHWWGGRAVGLAVLLSIGAGLGGCVRHQSQMESVRGERIEVAPEQGGYALAEVVE